MKTLVQIFVLCIATSIGWAGEADVLDLTDSDFSTRVGESENTLVSGQFSAFLRDFLGRT